MSLKKSENAWKAPHKVLPKEHDEGTSIIKAFKGILNKITANNVEKLTCELKSLVLDTEHQLRQIVKILFEKAVSEPMYANQYATICVVMSKTEVS